MLAGRERAEATAHLDRCAECREYIEQLALVGDGLLGLLPGTEPPAGFETRVARRLSQAAAARDGHVVARGVGKRRERSRRGIRLRIASAAAVLALGLGAGGWAVGMAIENVAAGPARPAQTVPNMLRADLTGAVAGHREAAGEIYAHPGSPPGSPGLVFMSVDLADAGIKYSGKVICLLQRSNGTTVRLGTFHMRGGDAYWGAPASVNLSTVSGVRLTAADGSALATAHFSGR